MWKRLNSLFLTGNPHLKNLRTHTRFGVKAVKLNSDFGVRTLKAVLI